MKWGIAFTVLKATLVAGWMPAAFAGQVRSGEESPVITPAQIEADWLRQDAVRGKTSAAGGVTPEQDAVRLPPPPAASVPVYYLRLEIEIIRGAADFDEAVGRICFPRDGARAG